MCCLCTSTSSSAHTLLSKHWHNGLHNKVCVTPYQECASITKPTWLLATRWMLSRCRCSHAAVACTWLSSEYDWALHNLRPQNITQNVDVHHTGTCESGLALCMLRSPAHTASQWHVDMARTDDSTPAVSFDMWQLTSLTRSNRSWTSDFNTWIVN